MAESKSKEPAATKQEEAPDPDEDDLDDLDGKCAHLAIAHKIILYTYSNSHL